MPTPHQIVPTGAEVMRHNTGNVLLRFHHDSGDSWTFALAPASIPTIVAELMDKSGLPPLVQASPTDFPKGTGYALDGQSVQDRPGGGAVLTLYVRLSDQRGVSLPIELPPRDLTHIVEELNRRR